MLLVVIGHRRKGGVSKARLGDLLGLDASPYLEELARLGLVYADPGRELSFWRPRPEALLCLGFRANADVPALKELEDWFDGQRLEQEPLAKARPGRRLKRERERRASVPRAAAEGSNGAADGGTVPGGEEGRADLLGGYAAPLPHPG